MATQTFTGSVYLIINKQNNKKYVGQTTRKVTIRFNEHCGKYKSALNDAIQKYGKDSFKVITLKCFACSDLETLHKQLDYWECWYIQYYNSYKDGYNCTTGGEHPNLTDEAKDKIRNKLLNHPVSNETKIKISLKNKGKYFGTPHKWTDKEKSEMSSKMKGNTNRRRPILQYSLDGEFIRE